MRRHSVTVCLSLAVVRLWTGGIARTDESPESRPSDLREGNEKEIRRSAAHDAPLVITDPVVVTATRAPKQLT